MGHYKELRAWQEAHRVAVEVYRLTERLPRQERYGLASQLRRSAFSVPANIVEGSRRRGKREFRHFLDIALGSLAEVEYGIEFAAELGLIAGSDRDHALELTRSASYLTFRLARSLDPRP